VVEKKANAECFRPIVLEPFGNLGNMVKILVKEF
jgi:hypothetical protein